MVTGFRNQQWAVCQNQVFRHHYFLLLFHLSPRAPPPGVRAGGRWAMKFTMGDRGPGPPAVPIGTERRSLRDPAWPIACAYLEFWGSRSRPEASLRRSAGCVACMYAPVIGPRAIYKSFLPGTRGLDLDCVTSLLKCPRTAVRGVSETSSMTRGTEMISSKTILSLTPSGAVGRSRTAGRPRKIHRPLSFHRRHGGIQRRSYHWRST